MITVARIVIFNYVVPPRLGVIMTISAASHHLAELSHVFSPGQVTLLLLW